MSAEPDVALAGDSALLVATSLTSSNRRRSTQEENQELNTLQSLEHGLRALADDLTVGVDRVSLRYPLAESAYGPELVPFQRRGRLLVEDEPHSPHIRVSGRGYSDDLAQQSCLTVTVDFNPSRSLPGEGLCPLAWTEPLVRKGFDALQDRLPCAVPASEVVLTRIDLARDFAVARADRWLAASVGTRAAHARKQAGYFGRGDGRLQTVVSQTASMRFNLYDKFEQAPSEHSRRHRLRWEAQITDSQPVRKLGVGSLDRLDTQHLSRAMAHLWTRSNAGEIVRRPSVGEAVSESGLAAEDKRAVLVWVEDEREQLGLHDDLTRREVQHRRRLAKDIGIHVRAGHVEVQTGLERLDLLLGTPVVAT